MKRAIGTIAPTLCLGSVGCRAAAVAVPPAALPPPDAFALVGAGDSADCGSSDDERTGELAKAVLDQRPLARACTPGSAQLAGLAADLARTTSGCRFSSRSVRQS